MPNPDPLIPQPLRRIGVIELLDLTGSFSEVVQVEVVQSPAGHDVLYVHVDGITLLRICRPKSISIDDTRPGIKCYEIWAEGRSIDGAQPVPCMMGIGRGMSFIAACSDLARRDEVFNTCYEPNGNTFWGCKLFQSEQEAHAGFWE